ncbi:MAG: phage tail sheath family protein [Anaerolineae bacterium]|nr:phage tail sheath family protein [Anaerolineae bacterium]
METGPAGPAGADNEDTVLLRIASANGDVIIEPAASNDLAGALMLGAAQGGLEVSRYAANRPAATGTVFDISGLVDLAEQAQTAFNTMTIGATNVLLGGTLITDAAVGARVYQDGLTPSITGNNDGIREKLGILAAAVNDARVNDPIFPWSAEVWGLRLALIPTAGSDNDQGAISTSGADGVDIGGHFIPNVRCYSLGATGQGNFQANGVAGNDGAAPLLSDYANAYTAAEKEIGLFNLLILPRDSGHTSDTVKSLWGPASVFCQERRAFLLMDAPTWRDVQAATHPQNGVNGLRVGLVKDYSAIFYPRLTIKKNGHNINVGPAGAIAGLMARIDASRGVWKAPAGTEADIRGIIGIEQRFSDRENGVLNPNAINTIRIFLDGIVNWGARTMFGYNNSGSEYNYIPIRRTALFLEESLYRGLKWVVFEPNDAPLWAQIRLNVGAFMHGLFRQGAFQGLTPKEAYFVKCDSETTTQADINLGIVNIIVGFAPLKPAEFVILSLQQIAGQLEAA